MNAKPSFFPVAADIVGSAHGVTVQRPRRLLDTTYAYDAELCGYDGPRDPVEDGEGLIIAVERGSVLSVEITSGLGVVSLAGVAEIKAAIHALQSALKLVGG